MLAIDEVQTVTKRSEEEKRKSDREEDAEDNKSSEVGTQIRTGAKKVPQKGDLPMQKELLKWEGR